MPENAWSLTLVDGYHPGISVPELAARRSFVHRRAFVMKQVAISEDLPELDGPLSNSIIAEVGLAISATKVRVAMGEKSFAAALPELAETIERGLTDGDAFLSATLEYDDARGACICLAQFEAWAYCGGPAPYHDSYTLAFYSDESLTSFFDAAYLSVCRRENIREERMIEGNPTPMNDGGWIRRLFGNS